MPLPMTLLAVLAPMAVPAEPARRLTPAQVERVLADAAERREAAEERAPAPPPAIHGEVGVEVGTGGHRAAFGTAVVPLGQDGAAVVSFSTETDKWRRGRRR